MARKKKKGWFGFRTGKKKTKAQLQRRKEAVMLSLKIIFAIIVVAAIIVGLYFLDTQYVRKETGLGSKWIKLELQNSPKWLSEDLKHHIFQTAGDGNGWFELDKGIAQDVHSRLVDYPWLHDIRVKSDSNSVTVTANYYKPSLLVETKNRKAYVASDQAEDKDLFNLIVLNYQPIYDLPIPVLKGISTRYMPEAGFLWQQEDVRAAVELVSLLKLMDKNMIANTEGAENKFRPLLNEIGSIDVSNFNGRKNRNKPHIILYSHDSTPIHWGSMQGNLEAVRVEKLGKLYQCYKDFGTLQLKSRGLLKYIDLTTATQIDPRP